MKIIRVSDKTGIDKFHELPYIVYRNDKNWVPPLRILIENIFDPVKNKGFINGDACRWVIEKAGKPAGRIAAFYNLNNMPENEMPTGGIGFFECIDDEVVAAMLFDTAKEWLICRGIEAMDGPINFGINFFNWGLLASGHISQTFGMQYHSVYYRKLFEAYGFKIYYEQYSYRMDIINPDLPERFWKIAAWVAKKPDFSFEHFKFKNQEKFVHDFLEIYSQAWHKHANYTTLDPDEVMLLLKESKLILEEKFMWFAYHKNEPIAFFMMIPDLNQLLSKINSGRLNFINIIRLIYFRKMKIINRCRVIVLGVIPRFQRSGIESGIFYHLRSVLLKKNWYREMEMSWVGDFNPKMNALFKSMGAEHLITHFTMRYLFDRQKDFIRLPVIQD